MELLPGEPLMSRDNLDSMRVANVATGTLPGLARLGIRPAAVEAMAPLYLGTRSGPARGSTSGALPCTGAAARAALTSGTPAAALACACVHPKARDAALHRQQELLLVVDAPLGAADRSSAFRSRRSAAPDWTPDSPFKTTLLQIAPTGRVPVLVDDGFAVWDTLAIVEYVPRSSRTGDLAAATQARARARSLCAEMHAGLRRLRDRLPDEHRGVAARRRRALCGRGPRASPPIWLASSHVDRAAGRQRRAVPVRRLHAPPTPISRRSPRGCRPMRCRSAGSGGLCRSDLR